MKQNRNYLVTAVEGLNGVGKSTLVSQFVARHSEVPYAYSAPEMYLKHGDFKKYILFDASPVASALYYLAALADTRRQLDRESVAGTHYLFDRSVWSTVAAAYAKDPATYEPLMRTVSALGESLLIPDTVVVLRGSYETCQRRISGKSSGAEFDRDSRIVFERKYELYDRIAADGYDVRFIDTDGKSAAEVLTEFENLRLFSA